MPDFFKVQGQAVYRPGVFPILDAEALAGLGPSPTGIVAVLGEFTQGGPPKTIMSYRSPGALRRTMSPRDATILGKLAFSPSSDPRIPNGAAQLLVIRVNPARFASLRLPDNNGLPSLVLTAWDAGGLGNDIRVQILPSTKFGNGGRKVVVSWRSITESVDNLGYDARRAAIRYEGTLAPDDIYEYMRAAIVPSGLFYLEWSIRTPKPAMGQVKEWAGPVPVDGKIHFATTDANGTETAPGVGHTVTITVSGYDRDTGQAVQEEVTISDTNKTAVTARAYSELSLIEINDDFGAATHLRIGAAGIDADLAYFPTLARLVSRISSESPNGLTAQLLNNEQFSCDRLDGLNIDLGDEWPRLGGTTKGEVRSRIVVTDDTWGGTNGPASYPAAWQGVLTFTLSAAKSNDLTLTITGIDRATNATATENVTIPAGAVTGQTTIAWNRVTKIEKSVALGDGISLTIDTEGLPITSNLDALVTGINRTLSFVKASRDDGAVDLPAVMSMAQNLVGGSDGIPASDSDWQEALDLLKNPAYPVNHVVCLTDKASVQVKLSDHLTYMCGLGMGVRNGYIGVPAGSGWSVIKERRNLVNNRNCALLAQSIVIYDENGERITLPPYYTALLAAACDAGRAPLSGLTWRYVSIIEAIDGSGLSGAERWAVPDDLEDLIANGVFVLEPTPNGWRWSRDVTTYAVDNNPIFCSITANESANRSVENVRRALERAIGNMGTTVAFLRAIVISELSRQKREQEVKDFNPKSIEIEDLGNGFNVGYEVAVLESTYWIRLTGHVVRMPSA